MSDRKTRDQALEAAVRIEVAFAGSASAYDAHRVINVARAFDQYLEPTARDSGGRFAKRVE